MRKKFAALLVIHLAALSFTAYPYVAMATFDAPESSESPQDATNSPTPLPPTPTPTPIAGTATKDPQITVTFNHWDPHDIAIPTKIEIISPRSNDSLPEGYVYLMVGISSSKWLINGVFCTADWFSGPQPIWYYNLRSTETVLYAMVIFTGVPAGDHTVSVHANLHDGTFLTSSVSFYLEPARPGER